MSAGRVSAGPVAAGPLTARQVDVPRVLSWTPDRLAEVAARLGRAARVVEESGALLGRRRALGSGPAPGAAPLPDGWHGAAAGAAARSREEQLADVTALAGVLRQLADVLAQAGEELRGARDALASASATACALGTALRPDGTCPPPAAPAVLDAAGRLDPVTVARAVRADDAVGDVGRRATAALARAAEADADAAARVRVLLAALEQRRVLRLPVPVGGVGALLAAQPSVVLRDPPRGAGPGEVARWWEGLRPDEAARLLAEAPQRVGGLPGVPPAVRAVANEQRARALRDRAARTPVQRRERAVAVDALAALAVAREGGRPASLLVLEPSHAGVGRAAVVVGDVGTADHVAWYVPGLGSAVSSLPGTLVPRGLALRDAAARREDEDVAVVVWMGYDAPEWDASVTTTARAEAGGRLLAVDVAGVAASRARRDRRGPPPATTTLVGHSYGSLTVGRALASGGARADAAVLLGSPGTGEARAAALGLPVDRVHVGAEAADPVSHLRVFGAGPASSAFGARRLPAQDTDGALLSLSSHGSYLDPRSESLAWVAAVVAGRGDEVPRVLARGRLAERVGVLGGALLDPERGQSGVPPPRRPPGAARGRR